MISAGLTSGSLNFLLWKAETVTFLSLYFSKPRVYPQEAGSGHTPALGAMGL